MEPFSLLRPWLVPALYAVAAVVLAVIALRIAIAVLRRLAQRQPFWLPFIGAAQGPGVAVAAFLALEGVLLAAPNALSGVDALRHIAALAVIGAATWLGVRLTGAIAEAVALRFPADVGDNLQARRVLTQTRLLTRTLASVIVLVGISFALLTFPGVRTVGAGLLASAGVAGLAVGIAAKPILGNLLAGVQIALTQPIRLDDVVIVEGAIPTKDDGIYCMIGGRTAIDILNEVAAQAGAIIAAAVSACEISIYCPWPVRARWCSAAAIARAPKAGATKSGNAV